MEKKKREAPGKCDDDSIEFEEYDETLDNTHVFIFHTLKLNLNLHPHFSFSLYPPFASLSFSLTVFQTPSCFSLYISIFSFYFVTGKYIGLQYSEWL